ncbi:hypothetical protein [Candidatus Tisiphia endosymbiont of Nemotelus uliginosus]|uniref:hypothetical protein n=1 Tax=Candidatus Tisiphia endosymbiont of Nemotelus uliginosus TaxID=3077926 RepID=UPI0035C8CCA8
MIARSTVELMRGAASMSELEEAAIFAVEYLNTYPNSQKNNPGNNFKVTENGN